MNQEPEKPKQADPHGIPKIPGEPLGDGFPPEEDVSIPPEGTDQTEDRDETCTPVGGGHDNLQDQRGGGSVSPSSRRGITNPDAGICPQAQDFTAVVSLRMSAWPES